MATLTKLEFGSMALLSHGHPDETRVWVGSLLTLSLPRCLVSSLPIPGLDGWQMLLLGAEGLLRRPLPSGAKEIADAFAGLLFVFAFSRC